MCLILICHHCVPGAPLVVGANREEAYARGGTEPAIRSGAIPFVAGLDPVAGGTWLGVNAAGVLVAVTNRRGAGSSPPRPRSRGLLVRDLLACHTAADAAERGVAMLSAGDYADCNLVSADRDRAMVIESAGLVRLYPLTPGVHVLTTGNLNDPCDARIQLGLQRFSNPLPGKLGDWITSLCGFLSLNSPPVAVCFHGADHGTVSSTVVALNDSSVGGLLLHAQGSPDRVRYQDRSVLLKDLFHGAEDRMAPAHRIRLAGPWEVVALARAGLATDPLPPPARMTMPSRWRDQGWAGFEGRVRHARRFARPTNLSVGETVWLTFAGIEGAAIVRLNGVVVGGVETGAAAAPFDVTGLLGDRNLLEVEVDGGPDGGLWGEVALEIRQSSLPETQPSR